MKTDPEWSEWDFKLSILQIKHKLVISASQKTF